MNWNRPKNDSQGPPARRREAGSLPSAVIEIQSEFVVGGRMRGASPPGVRRMAMMGLSPGVVEPSPARPNIAGLDDLSRTLRAVSKTLGHGGGRLGLLLPDAVARVNVLDFETLPSRSKELDALVRWRIRDSLGFAPEEARLSYQVFRNPSGPIELLVMAVKSDVLAQYETALQSVSGGLVLILPATMALLPLLSEAEPGGQILTHVCSGWVTHAVAQGDRLRFWRSRQLTRPEIDSGAAEVTSEAARAVASVRDRLGLEITSAWFCARPPMGNGLSPELSRTLGMPVESLHLAASVDAALEPQERPLFNPFGAPLAGLICNCGGVA